MLENFLKALKPKIENNNTQCEQPYVHLQMFMNKQNIEQILFKFRINCGNFNQQKQTLNAKFL